MNDVGIDMVSCSIVMVYGEEEVVAVVKVMYRSRD